MDHDKKYDIKVKELNDKHDALQKICDNWIQKFNDKKKEAEALAEALNLKKTGLDTTKKKIDELN